MSGHSIIVLGASAGGVEALTELARHLPADLPASLFVVLHLPEHGTSAMPRILNRHSALPAKHPKDGEPILRGHIYVAPPDYHLLIQDSHIRLTPGPRENGHRPAIDPLFRTAARTYGPRVIGAVLSGVLDDGTAGLQAIKMRGGIAVVQDPGEAAYSGMPRSAIDHVDVDYVLPIAEMAALFGRLASEPVEADRLPPASEEMEIESEIAEMDVDILQDNQHPGKPSYFGCPDCGGALWELQEGNVLRFRCRVGHAWSAESLNARQCDAVEEALWSAVRALEERASLLRRMAVRADERNHRLAAHRLEEEKSEAQGRATLIREVLLKSAGSGQEMGSAFEADVEEMDVLRSGQEQR